MTNMTRRTDSDDRWTPSPTELWLAEDRRVLDLGPAFRGTFDPALWPDPEVWTAAHDEPVPYWPTALA